MYVHREKAMGRHSKKVAIYKRMRVVSGETKPAKTLILDFQPPDPGEINFCSSSHPVFDTGIASLADLDSNLS